MFRPASLDGEAGAVSAEYGVLLGFIILLVVVGVSAYGTALGAFITRLAVAIRGVLGV